MVKRLVKQRSHPLERIKQIEFAAPPGEDYDDQHTGRKCSDVTIRIECYWPARLLATHDDVTAIACWARAHRIRVAEAEATAQGTQS